MNNWSIMTPYARLVFGGSKLTDFHAELSRMPGVKRKENIWQVPYNALEAVENLRCDYGEVVVEAASWGKEPSPSCLWGEIHEMLARSGEVQPWVLDGFLTSYQQNALVFGWHLPGVHYWHPTGSGKTLTGLLCALSTEGPIVVVTRAASRLQYAREVERFLNLRAYVVRPGGQMASRKTVNGESWHEFRSRHKGQGLSGKEVAQKWKELKIKVGVDLPKTLRNYLDTVDHRPVIVVGWEALTNNVDDLTALCPGAVIFDESHRGKNSKRWEITHLPDLPEDREEMIEQIQNQNNYANRYKGFIKDTDDGRKMFLPVESTASSAARLARSAAKRICTTATPIKDRVRDLWAQLDLGEPNAWGNSSAWRMRHCDMKPGTYGGMDDSGSSNLTELKTRLQSIAHILKYEETHRHLPQKRRQSVYISPEDHCIPVSGFAAELREAKKRGATAVLEVRLAQAASKKRKAVLGLIQDHISSNQKVVVFTGRRKDCEDLGKKVSKALKKDSVQVWSAHGSQSTEYRQEIVDEYMKHPGPCVLIGTGHAFGESLNIHDTDAALFVMLPYTPGQLRQWEGRFTRLGQKRPVVIYYVIAEGTVDEHVSDILINKLPSVEKIAEDTELAAAKNVLAGVGDYESEEDFAESVLCHLDF